MPEATVSLEDVEPSILPYAEVTFFARFTGNGQLPGFRGATIRGAFGHHLRRTVCHVRTIRCSDCIVRSNCVYGYIFEGMAAEDRTVMRLYPYVPQPFVVVTALHESPEVFEGNLWDFSLRLFGHAIDHFPYIAYSIVEAGKAGLGKDRIPFEITRITQGAVGKCVYEEGTNCLGKLAVTCTDFNRTRWAGDLLTVDFITPAKLRVEGRDVHQVNFSDIIRAASRRVGILAHFYGSHGNGVPDGSALAQRSEAIETVTDETRWFEFDRYSPRQDRRMTLGGVVGRMQFRGAFGPFRRLLTLTEVAGIGKATSFGFGRIAVS